MSKQIVLASLCLLTLSEGASAALMTIYGDRADTQVYSAGIFSGDPSQNGGQSGFNGGFDYSMVFVFQLPVLTPGQSITAADFNVFIEALKSQLTIHLLTADTYGSAPQVAQRLGVELHLLAAGPGGPQKADFVQTLGASQVAAMGNGANDAAMLRCARLGIAVLGDEGLAPDTLAAATVIVRHCHDGLDLLRYPARLLATLRL